MRPDRPVAVCWHAASMQEADLAGMQKADLAGMQKTDLMSSEMTGCGLFRSFVLESADPLFLRTPKGS